MPRQLAVSVRSPFLNWYFVWSTNPAQRTGPTSTVMPTSSLRHWRRRGMFTSGALGPSVENPSPPLSTKSHVGVWLRGMSAASSM